MIQSTLRLLQGRPQPVGTVAPFGNPIGPSGPLRQVYPVLPFVGSPVLSTKRNTRFARGVLVPVSALPNTPTLITHNLGRIPQGIQAYVNNGGTLPNPRMTLNAGTAPTRTQATIAGDLQMILCLVWLF